MSIHGKLLGKDDSSRQKTDDDTAKLRLHKEELDITKSNVQKGDVEISKEIIEERKIIDVPVTREEIVIERRNFKNQTSEEAITKEETIRIPVFEERVEVGKHTVVTGEITAHKQIMEDTKHIDETLKREEVRVKTNGNLNVADSSRDHH